MNPDPYILRSGAYIITASVRMWRPRITDLMGGSHTESQAGKLWKNYKELGKYRGNLQGL